MFKQNTISKNMLDKLIAGKRRIISSGLSNMKYYVESSMINQSVFMNKNGEADLYYTCFGLMLSVALGIKINCKRLAKFLDGFDTGSMDLIHYAAYVRCRILLDYLKYGKYGLFLKKTFVKQENRIPPLTGFPHNDPQSPYSQFILISLQEDLGIEIQDKDAIIQSLDAYRVPDGGFTNIRGHKVPSVNATAAALAVIGQLNGYKRNKDVDFLRKQQKVFGGFQATPETHIADLLSTSTAMFALSCYNIILYHNSIDFIDTHGLPSGGFKATIFDEDIGDVEYTFYGLLALGSWI